MTYVEINTTTRDVRQENYPELTTRGTARKRGPNLGLQNRNSNGRYFTGIPCVRGHKAERYVKSGSCVECQKLKTKEARAAQSSDYKRDKLAKRREAKPWLFLFNGAKRRAKLRNIPLTITAKDVEAVWPKDDKCPITGVVFRRSLRNEKGYDDRSPSIDRINPNLGYVPGNISIISAKANTVKSNVTDPEFFRRIANYLDTHKSKLE